MEYPEHVEPSDVEKIAYLEKELEAANQRADEAEQDRDTYKSWWEGNMKSSDGRVRTLEADNSKLREFVGWVEATDFNKPNFDVYWWSEEAQRKAQALSTNAPLEDATNAVVQAAKEYIDDYYSWLVFTGDEALTDGMKSKYHRSRLKLKETLEQLQDTEGGGAR